MPKSPEGAELPGMLETGQRCFGFAAANKDAIAKLKPGQKVTVKGKCMGKVATDTPSLEDSVVQ